jgi:hypothetical protein
LHSYEGCTLLAFDARTPHLDQSKDDSSQDREGRCNIREG